MNHRHAFGFGALFASAFWIVIIAMDLYFSFPKPSYYCGNGECTEAKP